SLRRALRALRNAQPRAAAELSELALAATLSAAVRARDLPALPRARRTRGRPSAAPRWHRRLQRAAARCRGRAVGTLAVGRVKAAELDAVTIDAHGTLVTLVDPVPELRAALAAHGVEHDREIVLRG